MMRVLDLFSGIGGFSLGLERAGMTTAAFCEIEEYPRKVLAKHWPDVPIYDDVRTLTKERLDKDGIGPIDLICGGFPCQDISVAGKKTGIDGERSGLWSECARLLREFRPRYAIFENVSALISGDNGRWFQRVLWDISQVGYDAEWHCIPASSLGAHHRRDRVWIVAYPNSDNIREQSGRSGGAEGESSAQPELYGKEQPLADSAGILESGGIHEGKSERGCKASPQRSESSGSGSGVQVMADSQCRGGSLGRINARTWRQSELDQGFPGAIWQVESGVDRVADGLPDTMDRLRGLGNAVVPQIPEIIGRAIMEQYK